MTNMQATFLYRRDITLAIVAYDRARRDVLVRFAGNSDAIQGAFCNLWGNCRVAFALAGLRLDKRRRGFACSHTWRGYV
jgi:hypothetical protein